VSCYSRPSVQTGSQAWISRARLRAVSNGAGKPALSWRPCHPARSVGLQVNARTMI
jgi:hypothetical protein